MLYTVFLQLQKHFCENKYSIFLHMYKCIYIYISNADTVDYRVSKKLPATSKENWFIIPSLKRNGHPYTVLVRYLVGCG